MLNNKRTYLLVGITVIATIVNGLLAGENIDRSFVAMPAWQQVGFVAWAAFSRDADLGTGQLLYPIMAIGGALLTIVAAVLVKTVGSQQWKRIFPFFLAAAFMIISLPISFKATPYMLSIRHINNHNIQALQQAFLGFAYWGRLQGYLHVAAFCSNLWALLVVLSIQKSE